MTERPTSRWAVVAAFAAVGAVTQVLWVTYSVVTTEAAKHFGVSKADIGWLANVVPLCFVLLAIPAGLLLDRWFRPSLAVGAVLSALGALLRVGGNSYGWAMAGQVVMALGQPLVLNAITGLTAHYLDEGDRAAGISIGSASTFAGLVLGFLLGTVFPHGNQLPTLSLVTAVLAVAACAALLLALAVVPADHYVLKPPAGLGAVREAWGDLYLRRLCLVVFIPFGTFIALTTWAQPLLAPAGVSESSAGLMLMLNVVAGVAGTAVLPVWAARRHKELTVMRTGIVVTALACLALAVAGSTVVGFLTLTLVGLVLLPALPIVLEMVERRAQDVEGTAAGLVWMAGNLGGVVIAGVIGLVVDHPFVAFAAMAGSCLLALPLLRLLSASEQASHA